MSHLLKVSTLFTAAMLALSVATPTLAQDTTQEAPAVEIKELFLGNEDATVTVIEYASYTCPHCASFHKNVFPQLKADYIDTGKIKFVNREVYFDRLGLWAAMLARCGDGSKYFGLTDMIYERQREWSSGEDGAAVAENLKKMGRIAGYDDAQLDACFEDQEKAQALVARFQETTEEHNVQSTPSLVINGVTYGNMNYADLKEKLDEALQ